ncbi:gamma-glutamylaminecyclotransferase-like [Corythoichthys intestinalis]|uniref:gamma-glutamylaminecyclotransferase-like n=1 Tax=Corythoichthys intestinalis TaxID=161448 RepID=UPI0025A66671|nr:gamma-glutamylaminecyclotransferase-like [Corythoichthys intestinalis]
MARVFVYGTLKRGQPNHFRMLDKSIGEAHLLASAVTTEKFPLVIAGEYNIPFLLNLPSLGHRVHGEIYRVDEQLLNFLDDFEDTPTMYQRTLVKLTVEEWLGQVKDEERSAAGDVTEAFVYSTTTYRPEWVSLPHYESYDSCGSHGLEYVRYRET